MQLFKKIPMKYKEKNYEIRVLYKDHIINVAAFLNNHPANGYRHQILLPKSCNIKGVLTTGIVDELIEQSKTDIIEEKVERLSKVIHENSKL